jgi:hypothetical protein
MADFAFQTLLKEGWVNFWRTAGFSAMEVIEVFDQPDEVELDCEGSCRN